MSIDIYDKADLIKKDNTYYYFVKSGSKNCFTCPFQGILGNDWNYKMARRQTRESNWKLIATGGSEEVVNDKIAETHWNAPTSCYYGQVRFGNKKNIALYFVKNKGKAKDYSLLTEYQKENIDEMLDEYLNKLAGKYTIDLKDIKDNEKTKTEEIYCGEVFKLSDNSISYNGKDYWNLNNL